jgi:uncharacterized small protein (DUF1192 family)
MQTNIDFDTLSYSQQLIEAGFTTKQAEIQAKTLKKIIESNLATKQDVFMLQKDISDTEATLQKDISNTKAELQKDISNTKAELQKDISNTKAELQKDISNTKAELQKDISDTKAEIIKWVAGMLVAQAAIVATLVKLL